MIVGKVERVLSWKELEPSEDIEARMFLDSGFFLTKERLAFTSDVEFLFEGFLPWGYVVVLSSEPGVGKSWLALALAREAIKKGVRVVYLDGDNPLPYVASNLRSFGLLDELGKKLFYASRSQKEFYVSRKDEAWRKLKSMLQTTHRSFIIIDALGPISRDYDLNSEKDVREVFLELKVLRDAGHAVLILHDDAEYGSLDVIKSNVDGLYFMERDKDGYVLHAKKLGFTGKERLRLCITVDGLTFGS